ncbi:nuclear condensing complex subunit [Flagelloscypha sp. PMI_526]|nr:nuclear condensing complex subunit [Flagelloscypha sp. PMI_526]
MPPRKAKEMTLDTIQLEMARIFDQVQNTTANHAKNLVTMHLLHLAADGIREDRHDGEILVGLARFEQEFVKALMLVLTQKKGQAAVDRVVKFAGGYVAHCYKKGPRLFSFTLTFSPADESGKTENFHYGPSFYKNIIKKTVFKGLTSKDKFARWRCMQLLVECLSALPFIPEHDGCPYSEVRRQVMERSRDKETIIRVQAAIALSTLANTDEDEDIDDPDDGPPQTTLQRLTEMMGHDPSGDVRRAALLNIPVQDNTIDEILKRTRDIDTATRKLVYSHVLANRILRSSPDGDVPDNAHPRVLTIQQRERVALNGLGDREPSVRSAAAALIARWLTVLTPEDSPLYQKKEEGGETSAAEVQPEVLKLTALLSLFVLQDESKIARDVLIAVFEERPKLFEALQFDQSYWNDLNPETVFLVRVYTDYCISTKDQARLEDALPVVTALAYKIQEYYNALAISLEQDIAAEVDDDLHDEQFGKELIIGEMLRIAVNLDYSDEMGRRKMYDLARGMLGQMILPESLIPGCLDVLKKLAFNEADLIQLVVGMVQDLRDPDGDDPDAEKSQDDDDMDEDDPLEEATRRKRARSSLFHKPIAELTPAEQAESDEVDMRCLTLCIQMMERVMGTLEEHSSMDGLIQELIIPFVQRKDLEQRNRGIHALGLVNLIARSMARQSLQLFFNQIRNSPPDLQVTIIKSIFDTMMIHHKDFLDNEGYVDYLIDLLTSSEFPLEPEVQALVVLGLSKLCLSTMLNDDEVLLMLWRAYMDPSTGSNQALRQNLAAFFTYYSHASKASQQHLCKIFPDIFKAVYEMREAIDEDEVMPTSAQIIGMFAEWTDALQVKNSGSREDVDEDLHVDFAKLVITVLLDAEGDFEDYLLKEDKKALCTILNKLSLPDEVDDIKIKSLKVLSSTLLVKKKLPDQPSKKAVEKFDTALSRKYETLSEFSLEEYREMEELAEAFSIADMLGDIEDDPTPAPMRKGKKRRSESMVSDSGTDVEERTREKGKSK